VYVPGEATAGRQVQGTLRGKEDTTEAAMQQCIALASESYDEEDLDEPSEPAGDSFSAMSER